MLPLINVFMIAPTIKIKIIFYKIVFVSLSAAIQDAHYIGCYAGKGKQSDGEYNDYAMRDWPYNSHSELTIDICIHDCTKHNNGYTYAGMVCWDIYQITFIENVIYNK